MSTAPKRNCLDGMQTHKLNTELDSHRGDYENLTADAAAERLTSVLGFYVTPRNVETAASIVGVTFEARQTRFANPFMMQLKATNERAEKLTERVDSLTSHNERLYLDGIELAKRITELEKDAYRLQKEVEALTKLMEEQSKVIGEFSAFFNRIMAIPVASNGHLSAIPKNVKM